MKKFFKRLMYFTTIITLFIPFLVFCACGFIAWGLFSVYDLVFEWSHEH